MVRHGRNRVQSGPRAPQDARQRQRGRSTAPNDPRAPPEPRSGAAWANRPAAAAGLQRAAYGLQRNDVKPARDPLQVKEKPRRAGLYVPHMRGYFIGDLLQRCGIAGRAVHPCVHYAPGVSVFGVIGSD